MEILEDFKGMSIYGICMGFLWCFYGVQDFCLISMIFLLDFYEITMRFLSIGISMGFDWFFDESSMIFHYGLSVFSFWFTWFFRWNFKWNSMRCWKRLETKITLPDSEKYRTAFTPLFASNSKTGVELETSNPARWR